MFFIFIFSLLTVSDLPMTTSNVGNTESQVSPHVRVVQNVPSISINGTGNESSRSLYKSITSTEDLSFPAENLAHTNLSTASGPGPAKESLSPTAVELKNTVEVTNENKIEARTIDTDVNQDHKIVGLNSQVSASQDKERTDTQKSISPLKLKLDREYTPGEIAEYIFITGDEKGIAQVVAEMVEDGQIMASRDDLIVYLETVQRELAKLKDDKLPGYAYAKKLDKEENTMEKWNDVTDSSES